MTDATQQPQPKKTNWVKIILIIIGVLLLVSCLCITASMALLGPQIQSIFDTINASLK